MIVVQVGVKKNVKFMVAAPYKKHQNDVNKWVYTVHTQELNWVQNKSIFLELVAKQVNIFLFNS
jgi:hypothetical protein